MTVAQAAFRTLLAFAVSALAFRWGRRTWRTT